MNVLITNLLINNSGRVEEVSFKIRGASDEEREMLVESILKQSPFKGIGINMYGGEDGSLRIEIEHGVE